MATRSQARRGLDGLRQGIGAMGRQPYAGEYMVLDC